MSRSGGKALTAVVTAVKGAAGFAVLLAVYELLRLTSVLPEGSAPSTSAVLGALVDGFRAEAPLRTGLLSTAQAWSIGVLVAVCLGMILGAAVGLSAWADALTRTSVEFLRPVPAVALVPVAIVLFGLQITMQVFLVAVACIWPVLVGTKHAVRAVDPLLLDTARMLGLSRMGRLRRVMLPAAVPSVATGIRTAAGLGVVVAVAAELVSGSPGLGNYLIKSQQAGQTASAFAGVLLAGVLGLTVNVVLAGLERRVSGWQIETTEGRR